MTEAFLNFTSKFIWKKKSQTETKPSDLLKQNRSTIIKKRCLKLLFLLF